MRYLALDERFSDLIRPFAIATGVVGDYADFVTGFSDLIRPFAIATCSA